MVSHADVRAHCVVNNAPLAVVAPVMDGLLGSVRHEDAVTPGRTASVHVLGWFSVLLTVGVARGKCDVLFPNNIMEGCDFFVIFQKRWDVVLPEIGLVQVGKHFLLDVEQHLVVIVLLFPDDFLHFIAVLPHCLHICLSGQMLDKTESVQTEVEISKQEERQRRVAAI